MASVKLSGLLFSSEESEIPTAPSPPTGKQMMEDLETCSKNDPVILVGKFLQERVKSLSTDVHSPTTAGDAGQRPVRGGSENFYEFEHDSSSDKPLMELIDVSALTTLKKLCSNSNSQTGVHKQQISSENVDTIYERVKNLTNVCEKAQDVLNILEPELKNLRCETMEFRNSLEDKPDNK